MTILLTIVVSYDRYITLAFVKEVVRKICRRWRTCAGDPHICVKRALGRVPHPVQVKARETILAAMPHNISAPEREARQRMPRDSYE